MKILNHLMCVLATGICYYAFLILCLHFRLEWKCIYKTLILTITSMLIINMAVLIGVYLPACIMIVAYIYQEAVSIWLSEYKFTLFSDGSLTLRRVVLGISYIIITCITLVLNLPVPLCMIICACLIKACSELWLKEPDGLCKERKC